jgi:hypothetical protein
MSNFGLLETIMVLKVGSPSKVIGAQKFIFLNFKIVLVLATLR